MHNTHLVLKTIYDSLEISRADIARETGLTRPTVSDVVSDLLNTGLVEEVGYGPSTGGKPPILLSVADDSRQLIGIDLASGEFRGAVVNLRGETRQRINRPLHGQEGSAALDLAYDLIDDLVAAADAPLLGIGIGTPGLMDTVNGVVRWAVNLGWRDLPLRKLLQERYALPVYVANDCHAAALAEHTFGDGRDVDNLVVIKVEHGIGSGILINGRLFYGDTFGAGEIGHVSVVENGERCRCGNVGCLETVASARALVERARSAASDGSGPGLSHFSSDPDQITMETLCELFQDGDAAVAEMVRDAGRHLGRAAASLVGVLSTRRILIAGSVTCFGDTLLDAVRDEMTRRSLDLVARETEIGLSTMGPDIVILGASALVLNYELGLLAPLAGLTAQVRLGERKSNRGGHHEDIPAP
ncbi:MAG: ROK family transcriptional regulator [Chloroflexota bacterium]|nr:ROK family transcriptional regulator [Chloroflexota bacterium]